MRTYEDRLDLSTSITIDFLLKKWGGGKGQNEDVILQEIFGDQPRLTSIVFLKPTGQIDDLSTGDGNNCQQKQIYFVLTQ